MMGKELAKTYNPKEMEGRLYQKWEKNGYFHVEPDKSKKPFTIMMPQICVSEVFTYLFLMPELV